MTNFNASSFRFFERKVAQGIALSDFSGSLLYHTKNYQGTTTHGAELLHTLSIIPYQELPGNYNRHRQLHGGHHIIPYQELPGNYNFSSQHPSKSFIIPYQELPGNYNKRSHGWSGSWIIPYQELPGNYNNAQRTAHRLGDYTIPRTTRELQRTMRATARCPYYTIPRTTRELQLYQLLKEAFRDYTIPRTTRELQPNFRFPTGKHVLYHTKNYQGTTTKSLLLYRCTPSQKRGGL